MGPRATSCKFVPAHGVDARRWPGDPSEVDWTSMSEGQQRQRRWIRAMGRDELARRFARRGQRGLTLVEMMLAILGLSLIMNVIWSSIASGLRAERNAEFRGVAIRLASSELARARVAKYEELSSVAAPAHDVTINDRTYKVETAVKSDPAQKLCTVVTTVTWKVGMRQLDYQATLIRSEL